jgi:hypothetical protein
MSLMFIGPILAALVSAAAVYALLRMLQDSDKITADKLARETVRKPAN